MDDFRQMASDDAGVFLGDARLSAAPLAGDLSQAQERLAYVNGCPARRNPQDQA